MDADQRQRRPLKYRLHSEEFSGILTLIRRFSSDQLVAAKMEAHRFQAALMSHPGRCRPSETELALNPGSPQSSHLRRQNWF